MSKWTQFATKFYNDKKKQNKDYKFSQALKDASKEYKGGAVIPADGVTVDSNSEETTAPPPPLISTTPNADSNADSNLGGKRRKSARKSGGRKSHKARKSRKSRK